MQPAISTSTFLLSFTILLSCAGRPTALESQTSLTPSLRKMPAGNCEGCDLMFAGIPQNLNSVDTSDGWNEEGQKLIVSGKVFHLDKKTPASDVILYYYHTDQKGNYDPGDKTDAGSRRHGRLRGWVKTGADGTYSIYTNRPAQYPSNSTEAHIHVLVKEADIDKPYWIDGWVFDDDPLLTSHHRSRLENRGGNGIMKTRLEGDVQVANQDIILGLNIPGYPN